MKLARIAIGITSIAWLAARSGHHHVPNVSAQNTENSRSTVPNAFGMFGAEAPDENAGSASISGRVLLKSGKPVKGAMACAFCADCEDVQLAVDLTCEPTDDTGHYVLRHLRSTDYQVSISAEGFRPRIANKGEPIQLQGKDIVLPDTELEEGGAQVVGIVSDATGGGRSREPRYAPAFLPTISRKGDI